MWRSHILFVFRRTGVGVDMNFEAEVEALHW